MKFIVSILTATSLALALLANPAASLKSAQADPSGSYCGSYMANMVVGTVTMNPKSSTFDITVKAFGNSESTCRSIKYVLEKSTGDVVVPDAHDSKSCLGDLLASGGLGLEVKYDSKKDIVQLDLGIAKLSLHHC